MEIDRIKISLSSLQISKEFNSIKNKKIKPIALYSSNSNGNITSKHMNFIPLSLLFKNKINNMNRNDNNNDSNEEKKQFNNVRKNHKNHTNLLLNYNSLYCKKKSLIKLPKIKKNIKNNEILDSKLYLLFNKFDQYDNKFKEQEKISDFIIQRGDKYLKLRKEYLDENEKYKYCASKHNYKNQYNKLFKRIKNMHYLK